MSESMGGVANEFISKTRAGTSFWTTFRWVADLVYGVCWIIALPLELLLNRRMGRRYNSLLPLTIAMLLMFGLYSYFGWGMDLLTQAQSRRVPLAFEVTPRLVAPQLRNATPTVQPQAQAAATAPVLNRLLSNQPYFLPGVLAIMALAVLAHRLDNWWRFRSTEQVHSRHCGVPHWVWWLWAATAKDEKKHQHSVAEVFEAKPAASHPAQTASTPTFFASLRSSLRSTLRGFTRGVPPTGPLAWLAATVVHPIALWLAAAIVASADAVIAIHLVLVAMAIFVKARIQKALVVETIYDVFDARIERTFLRGLESPEEMAAAGRAGMVVPGVAELMPQAISRLPKQSALSPEYQALVAALGEQRSERR